MFHGIEHIQVFKGIVVYRAGPSLDKGSLNNYDSPFKSENIRLKGSDRQSEVVELSMQYCAQIL